MRRARRAALAAALVAALAAVPAAQAWDDGPVPVALPPEGLPTTPRAPAPPAPSTTTPAPAPAPARGLVLGGLATGARVEVDAALASYPAQLRRILARVPIPVTVDADGACSPASCVEGYPRRSLRLSLAPQHMGDARVLRHVLAHELGHVVEFTGLTAQARAAWDRWAHERGAPACIPFQGGCVRRTDVFADNVAFWATRDLEMRSDYNVPPLVSRAEMSAFLARWWRPAGQAAGRVRTR